MILPPRELTATVDANHLGAQLLGALDEFRDSASSLRPEEWESLNRQLLDHFGERSIAAFERKKREVTVRREVESGEIHLFSGKGEHLGTTDPVRLGEIVKELLRLPA